MLKVAVIGTGAMGCNHVRVLRDLGDTVELVGVADPDPVRLAAVGRRFGVDIYARHEDLLDRARPDAVIVAVPTAWHHEVAMAVIDRRCPLLVEKPLAATTTQAKDIVSAAEAAGVPLAVGHIERFNPAVVELKRRMDDALGRAYLVHSRRQSPYPGRILDVGVVADLATHELDMMRHVTGAEVVEVQASSSQVLHPTREDIVFGLLGFDNGVMGILDVNWVTPTKIRDISVTGERGMFTVNYLTQELFFFANAAPIEGGRSRWTPGGTFGVNEGDMVRHHIEKREPLRDELVHFLEVVVRGGTPRVSGEDGLRALELAELVREKASESRGLR